MKNIIMNAMEARRQSNMVNLAKERKFMEILKLIEKEIKEVVAEGENTAYVCLSELAPYQSLKDDEAKEEMEEKVFESLKEHGYDYSWIKSVKEITIDF